MPRKSQYNWTSWTHPVCWGKRKNCFIIKCMQRKSSLPEMAITVYHNCLPWVTVNSRQESEQSLSGNCAFDETQVCIFKVILEVLVLRSLLCFICLKSILFSWSAQKRCWLPTCFPWQRLFHGIAAPLLKSKHLRGNAQIKATRKWTLQSKVKANSPLQDLLLDQNSCCHWRSLPRTPQWIWTGG